MARCRTPDPETLAQVTDTPMRPQVSAGHEVKTPTLSGLGDRAPVPIDGAALPLELHIEDVPGSTYFEDLGNVTLVGWSKPVTCGHTGAAGWKRTDNPLITRCLRRVLMSVSVAR